MLTPTEPASHIRAAIARLDKHLRRHPDDAEARAEIARLRREHAAVRLEDYIRKVVDQAPPLTAEQRDRLSVLLRGTAA